MSSKQNHMFLQNEQTG